MAMGRDDRRPVLALAPAQLPPATGDPVPSRSFARRALLSVVLMAGVPVVGLAVIIGLLAVNVIAIVGNSPILIGGTLVAIVSVARGIVASIRKPPAPRDELEVTQTEETELAAMVAEIANEVGTDPPDRIVLVPEVNAYVSEFGPFMGLARGKRTLAIGAPLLDVLTVSQLRAVLAHELGHFAGGDTRLGPIAHRTEQSLAHIIELLEGRWTAVPFVGYARFQRKFSASARRDQELVADRAAVRVAGRQAMADALWALEITSRGEAALIRGYLLPLLGAGCQPTNLADGLRSLLMDPTRILELSSERIDQAEIDPWASHPPTLERIARVAAQPDHGAVTNDRRAARAVFRQPDRWIDAVNDQWVRSVTRDAQPLTTVPWEEWGERVMRPLLQGQAVDVDAALAKLGLPPGVEGLHEALSSGRDRELAAALIAHGWRSSRADEREVLLRTALVAAAGHRAVTTGRAEWRLSWAGPVELRLADGEIVELRDIGERAVRGEWGPILAVGSEVGAEPAPSIAFRQDRETDLTIDAPLDPDAAATGGPNTRSTTMTLDDLPPAPSPQFLPAEAPWRWEAKLSARMKKQTLLIGEHGIGIAGIAVDYDDIEHAAVRIKPEGVTGFSVTITLTPNVGEPVTLRVSTSNDDGRAQATAAATYVRIVLRALVAPRLCDDICDRLRRGETVPVGGLLFSPQGIAKPDDSVVHPWPAIQDARLVPVGLQIYTSPSSALLVKHGSEDELLVTDLIPRLRMLFS